MSASQLHLFEKRGFSMKNRLFSIPGLKICCDDELNVSGTALTAQMPAKAHETAPINRAPLSFGNVSLFRTCKTMPQPHVNCLLNCKP
jgi:hypothetical protein